MSRRNAHHQGKAWTETGPGDPRQWLHVLYAKKRERVSSRVWRHNVFLTLWTVTIGLFQRLYLEYFIPVISAKIWIHNVISIYRLTFYF